MNNSEKIWKVGKWVGIMLIVFLVVISLKELKSIDYVGKNTQITNSISINGKGESIIIPDIATFSFSVTETGKTVSDAQTKANEKTSTALKAVRAGGVLEKDIKTISYSINPHYEYTTGVCAQTYPYICPPAKSVLTGYDVSQTIEVKVRDLAKAGELFDAIGGVGIQSVNGLTFSIDDIDSVKATARTEAIADAKVKAEKIAKELGVRLVRITSFYDSSDSQPYYGMGGGEMMDKVVLSAAPRAVAEIPKGEQKVTATVTITYEIK